MSEYDLLVETDARAFIEDLDDKSERICKDNLMKLVEDPYPRPGAGAGDREQLTVDGEEVYRLHISRTFTAFYDIHEDEKQIKVLDVLPIDEAHDRYGHDI
ncbi:type II toxin-antitoxin system RelE/ParE family toxin [Halorientalis halophila]|uniref:type II toxin-antitoxin system RelE/ParE family toxin n=1 Tax=Halorientalis halophila TaxID=3108499 RepID=UPI00300958D1